MYAYGGDGYVVTPDKDAYQMVNQSQCPVQITSITGEDNWDLKDTLDGLQAGDLYLRLSDQVVTHQTTDTSWDVQWRIGAAESSDQTSDTEDTSGTGISDNTASDDAEHGLPSILSIPIQAVIAGGSVNEDGEARACTVYYTAGIAQ
jgi:hypothetical protein